MAWKPLTPFGAEIDCDLATPLSAEEAALLKRLVFERQLLVFRGQTLTHDRQVDVLEHIAPVIRSQEFIHYISTDEGKGTLGRQRLPYHSDVSFVREPCRVLSLHATDLVDGASSTKFVSGIRALKALSSDLRARIETLNARHVMPWSAEGVLHRDAYDQTHLNEEPPQWIPRQVHPLVLNHPVTGVPILFVNELLTGRVCELGAAESRDLLDELFGYLYDPANVYEHVWHKGDLLVWDNIALQHARGDVSACGRRTLQKVVIGTATIEQQWPGYLEGSRELVKVGVDRGM